MKQLELTAVEQIRTQIHPVPQQVTMVAGEPLVFAQDCKWNVTAPQADKGPVKTATEDVKRFLQKKCGEDCFDQNGKPVVLQIAQAPAEVTTNQAEGYCLEISADGITITGYGESGLYYGVVTMLQLGVWDEIPAVRVLDWPDNLCRAFKQECRYGSNVMEKEDWLAMIDDLAAMKLNTLSIALYGCWVVQFDGKVAEYLYLPLKKYPHVKTPQIVRYYSPTEGRWIDYETLPPIFRDDFFGELVRYAKDRAIEVVPGFNSLGHNTVLPSQVPEVAPQDENGNIVPSGFCTSKQETYDLLFSVYDQLIDECLLPNGVRSINIHLDEVYDEAGVNAERRDEILSPWCKCEKCRTKEKKQIYIDHLVKVASYLKSKGMETVFFSYDMLVKESSNMGFIGDDLLAALRELGLQDNVIVGWWCYVSHEESMAFKHCHDELGLRSVCNPWNGYYTWCVLTNPLGNVKIMADLNRRTARGEGIYMYAMWDKSFDRIHNCLADYGWNHEGTGDVPDVTKRYVARHFPTLYEKCLHGYRLIDWISEERLYRIDKENPKYDILGRSGMLLKTLTYYTYCYYERNKPFPRHFPGEPLQNKVLIRRHAYERELYAMASMAKEAIEIFREAAQTPGCDQEMAKRMEYECHNYQCLAEDWLALLRIYDLTQSGDQKKIAPIARERYAERIALMTLCEQTKEKWAREGAGMRELSVMMQVFADIYHYIESTDEPKLDLFDITPIMSPESFKLR